MNKRFYATLLAMPLALSNAFADDATGGPVVKISGYGTAAMTWADTDKAEFSRPNQSGGVSRNGRTGIDSNLGLQANVAANDWLSGTVQGLVRKDGDDNYGAELAWAFAKAQVSEHLSLRIGRMGLPVFMISDYRNVGYANTMLRPPGEVYSQVVLNTIDGIDATYQRAFGDTNLTAQLAVGSTKTDIASNKTVVHLDGKSITALNLVAERGPLTLRFGRADTRITINDSADQNALIGGLRAAAVQAHMPSLGTLANSLVLKDKKASFTSVGLGLDWNNIVVQSEYAKRKTDSYVNDTTSWYLMGGYRIGKFLPYYSHANLSVDHIVANTVPRLSPGLIQLSNGVTKMSSTGTQGEQSTDTIGLRWDFHRSAALKVQIDRIHPKNGNGLLLAPAGSNSFPAGAPSVGPVTVGAVAIDFVF